MGTARRLLLAIAAALLCAAPARAAGAPLTVVYATAPAAAAIHDGAPGLPGIPGVVRQAPIFDDPRFPGSRQLGKVSGRDLAALDAAGMAAALRAAMRDPRLGPLAGVGVDEIGLADWGERQSAELARALEMLGPDAERVVLYAGPSLVGAVAQRDPRRPLPRRPAAALDALARAGHVMLTMFHGGARPLSRQRFAVFPTRWLERFPAARRDRLHLLIGPERGLEPGTLWEWARATPAGRRILANGAGAYGQRTEEEGRAWLRGARGFLAAPGSPPPSGDFPVRAGGLSVGVARDAVIVRLERHGRALVRLVPPGERRGRVIGRLRGPTPARGARVPIPANVRPGRYRVVVVALGQAGVRDRVARWMVRRPSGRPLVLEPRGGALAVTVPPGQRAVVSIMRGGGRRQAVAKLRGPATRTVALPPGLPPGSYRVVAVAVGNDGRQQAEARVTVGR